MFHNPSNGMLTMKQKTFYVQRILSKIRTIVCLFFTYMYTYIISDPFRCWQHMSHSSRSLPIHYLLSSHKHGYYRLSTSHLINLIMVFQSSFSPVAISFHIRIGTSVSSSFHLSSFLHAQTIRPRLFLIRPRLFLIFT